MALVRGDDSGFQRGALPIEGVFKLENAHQGYLEIPVVIMVAHERIPFSQRERGGGVGAQYRARPCLLYTSDAADE